MVIDLNLGVSALRLMAGGLSHLDDPTCLCPMFIEWMNIVTMKKRHSNLMKKPTEDAV